MGDPSDDPRTQQIDPDAKIALTPAAREALREHLAAAVRRLEATEEMPAQEE